jgi:crossover junction endodeoxyribonuclease RusA
MISTNKIFVYRLPIPPSVNSLWRITGRRMYRSKKYMQFIVDCEKALEGQQKPAIDYNFDVEIIVGRPSKRRMDIDNRGKAIMDVLQHLEIITDDCLANRVTMMWSNDITDCKITISGSAAH